MKNAKRPPEACAPQLHRRTETRRNFFAALLAAALSAIIGSAQADPAPPHGIVAATIGVRQLSFDNSSSAIVLSNKYTIGDFRVRSTANYGDYDVQIGENLNDDVDGGVLITSIAENGGRDNVDADGNPDPIYPGINVATSHIDYTRTGANAGGYWIPLSMTFPNSVATTVVEYNMNVSAAWFPYNKWLGGFVRNSGTTNGGTLNLLTGSSSLALGTHFIDNGGGKATVNLTSLGINSQTDGVLLVVGAKNEDNYALSLANANGTWTLISKDNGTDGASTEQDPLAFVYIPKTNNTVVSGRFNGDGAITIFSGGASPNFTVANFAVGQWELKIAGHSPRDGVLLVSPEGGQTQNRDNIVTADANATGDGWIIESRDLPSFVNPSGGYTLPPLETPGVEPVASFVFIPGPSPGISVTPSSNLFTTENGASASFTVSLDTKPIADVTIAVSSDDLTEGTVSPSTLTFTADNWDQPQTVSVTGVDDDTADGPIAYHIILGAATSTDADYSGRNPVDVAVVNLDNDGALTVNPTSGLVTTEAGGTATFTVRLDQAPTADVTIALSSSNPAEGVVAPASLVFTTDNWNQEQTVTITGVDDFVDDGDVNYTIVTAPAVSADPFFNGRNAPDISVKNIDDDIAAITVTPTRGLTFPENGGTATYTVVLASQPTANVDINVVSGKTSEGTVAPAKLTFTASDWNTPKSVTITGVDDLVVDGNISFTITNTVSSADLLYQAIDPADVIVTSLDNEAVLTLFNEPIVCGLGMPPIGIAGRASIVDPNTPSYNGAKLTIAFTANAAPQDRLEIRSGSALEFATVSGGTNSLPLVITFQDGATSSSAEAALHAVVFQTATNASTATRTVQITLAHADTGTSQATTKIRVGLLRAANFQEGADHGYGAYTGENDIELYELQPDSPKPTGRGASGLFIDWRDADTPNAGNILLRFDDIVGSGPGQIPTNSIIVSAELFLHMNDTGDGSPLHRMMIPWDAQNETWNSIGGGITPDDIRARTEYDSQIGVQDGSGATTVGTVWVSVSPDIDAWVNGGEANYGWAMPAWPFNLDGTGFSPSEAPNINDRPRLRVYWLPKDSTSVASFRQGVNDYAGAVDTRIRQVSPDTDFSAAGTVFSDAVVSGTDPNPEQVLLRFGNIIGSEANQIPPGARIEAAFLDVASLNGDAMGDGGQFFSILQTWPETVTWNGWVDGIQTNGVEAATTPTALAGNPDLNPDVQGGFLSFDLTADVQSWASGSIANNGWVIIPWPGGGNGWGFYTSENSTERNRPRLRVYYTAATGTSGEIHLESTFASGGSVQIRLHGDANKSYTVYRAQTIDGAWTIAGTVATGADGNAVFTDPTPPATTAFYRAAFP